MLAKSSADVDKMYGGKGELPSVLREYLTTFAPKVQTGQMYQADHLFLKEDLKEQNFENEKYITCPQYIMWGREKTGDPAQYP